MKVENALARSASKGHHGKPLLRDPCWRFLKLRFCGGSNSLKQIRERSIVQQQIDAFSSIDPKVMPAFWTDLKIPPQLSSIDNFPAPITLHP